MDILADDMIIVDSGDARQEEETDDNSDTIVAAPVYEFQPLPTFAWAYRAKKEAEDAGDLRHYCYLCEVAKEGNGKNPARDRIEQKLLDMAGQYETEHLCKTLSDYHFLTVVKKTIAPQEQEKYRWKPHTIFFHSTQHIMDEKMHLLKSLWQLDDYDQMYTMNGCKIDVQTQKKVLPSFGDVRAHMIIMQNQARLYAQLRSLNKKDRLR